MYTTTTTRRHVLTHVHETVFVFSVAKANKSPIYRFMINLTKFEIETNLISKNLVHCNFE